VESRICGSGNLVVGLWLQLAGNRDHPRIHRDIASIGVHDDAFAAFHTAKFVDSPVYGFKKLCTSIRWADQHILSNTVFCRSPIQNDRNAGIEDTDGKAVRTSHRLEKAIDGFKNEVGPRTFLIANASIDKDKHVEGYPLA
jgi:hypothetical protein